MESMKSCAVLLGVSTCMQIGRCIQTYMYTRSQNVAISLLTYNLW